MEENLIDDVCMFAFKGCLSDKSLSEKENQLRSKVCHSLELLEDCLAKYK